MFLFFCNITYPKSSYQSRTETQNNLHCWKHRLTTCSSSNSCTSLAEKNGSVRILLSLGLPGPSLNPHRQQAHLPCWYTSCCLGRQKPDTAAAGEEHTWERTWLCEHHTWQRPPMLTVPRDQFGSAAKIYKFTYILFFPLCPYPSSRDNSSCLDHSHWYQNYCKDKNILRKCK